MSPISAAYSPEASNIFTPTVKDGVTSLKGMADNTQRNDIQNDIHSMIAGAEAYLTSMKQEQNFTPIVEMPKTSHLSSSELEDHVMRRFSQTALQSIRSVLSGETMVFTAELSKMANLQSDLSQLCLRVQQSRLKANSESMHELSLKNIEKLQEAIDLAAKSKAEQEKMGFWGKLSNILGVAAAVAGILLAPLTGGLSLLATGYLAVDLGLQIGEQATGIKMSIESGLQKGIKALLMLLPEGTLSESQCDMIAGIVSSIICMIVAIGMSVVSAGAGAPKIFSAFAKLAKFIKGAEKVETAVEGAAKLFKTVTRMEKIKKAAPKFSMAMEGTTHVASAVAGATSGAYGIQNASSEFSLNDIEVQRKGLETEKALLMQAFEQCKDDSQKITEGMRHMLTQIADMSSTYYSASIRVIDSMSKIRYAA